MTWSRFKSLESNADHVTGKIAPLYFIVHIKFCLIWDWGSLSVFHSYMEVCTVITNVSTLDSGIKVGPTLSILDLFPDPAVIEIYS